MYFRIILLLIWINFFAVFILDKVGFVSVLNPFKFLIQVPMDKRQEISLYFPGSLEGLMENQAGGEKTSIVELRQKTSINKNYETAEDKGKLLVKNAWFILEQLSTAPDSIRGVRAINDLLVVKKVWFYNGQLFVHIDKKRLADLPPKQREIIVSCIRKSLQANLGAFSEIVLTFQ